MILAAIDIGSNAIRLQVVRTIDEDGYISFKKLEFLRFPLRLGKDAFNKGEITTPTIKKFKKLMHAFKLLIDLYEVDATIAVATSAMREARNGESICSEVLKEIGVKIDVISGQEEAIILTKAIIPFLDEKTYVHIDVGGGSTELTIYENKLQIASQSFKLGSVRKLNEKKRKVVFTGIKTFIKENESLLHSTIYTIGTGGNINKLFKLSNQKFNQSISLAELRALNAYVREYSLEERVRKLKMNPDRADVIIPASLIYIELMKIVESDQMFVPGVGLKDGLLYQLFESTAKVNVKNIQFLGSFG